MNDLTKSEAVTLSTMVEAKLLWYKHLIPWADEIIKKTDECDDWVYELSLKKYSGDIVKALNRFAFSEPFERFDDFGSSDEFVAAQFIRYEIGAISWARFLTESGGCNDGTPGKNDCEHFYYMLNDLEDSKYDKNLELKQAAIISAEYLREIEKIKNVYDKYTRYYRSGP